MPNYTIMKMATSLACAGYGIYANGFKGEYFEIDGFVSDLYDTFESVVCAAYAHMVIENVRARSKA